MKKIPRKAILVPDDPIKIEIDPYETLTNIKAPMLEYSINIEYGSEVVFNGMVLPIPKVLPFFLTQSELLVFILITEETNKYGMCVMTVTEIAHKLGFPFEKTTVVLASLRGLGLLLETPNGKRGNGRERRINYATVQHLNDLLKDEDLSVYKRLRRKSRKRSITSITRADVESVYNHKILGADHDPEEEEEYD